jgi:AraC-like DNA-binding protein
MTPHATDRFADVPLRNVKASLDEGESARRNPTPRGGLIDVARKRCGLEVKQMAAAMGVSESFLLRGFKDQEHISYQRLRKLPAKFHRERLVLEAQELDGVEVVTGIRIPA